MSFLFTALYFLSTYCIVRSCSRMRSTLLLLASESCRVRKEVCEILSNRILCFHINITQPSLWRSKSVTTYAQEVTAAACICTQSRRKQYCGKRGQWRPCQYGKDYLILLLLQLNCKCYVRNKPQAQSSRVYVMQRKISNFLRTTFSRWWAKPPLAGNGQHWYEGCVSDVLSDWP